MEKEMGPHDIIQFVGVSDLSAEEQAVVHRICGEEFDKVKRSLQNITDLIVHVKCYACEGARKKYSLHIKVCAPTGIIAVDRADDWELPRALHKAFNDVRGQIKHKFHSDTSRPDRGLSL